MEQKTYTFTVRGRGMFPFDMLRYDRCWPAREEDSTKIDASTRRGRLQPVDINLTALRPSPTVERWTSFGWQVL